MTYFDLAMPVATELLFVKNEQIFRSEPAANRTMIKGV